MRVVELAEDLNVSADTLLLYLRQMGIAVGEPTASVSDADVARILARVEKERRAAGKESREVVEAAIEEAQGSKRRRRRRRRSEPEEPEQEGEPEASAAVEGDQPAEGDQPTAAAEEPEGREPAQAEPSEATGEAGAPEDEEPEAEAEPAEETPEPAAAEAPAEEPEGEAEKPRKPEPVAPGISGRRRRTDSDEEAPGRDGDEAAATPPAGEAEEATPQKPEPPTPARTADGGRSGGGRRLKRKAKGETEQPKPSPAASAGPGGKVRIQAEGYTEEGKRKKGKKGKKRQRVDQDSVQDNVQRVMAELKGGGGGGTKKRRRSRARQAAREEDVAAPAESQEGEQERQVKPLKVNEFLTPSELGELIDVPPTEIISSAFKNLGMMVTVNQRLDFDQIELLLEEFGYRAERQEAFGEEQELGEEEEEDPDTLVPRPPVVTVMGHVDHGKTLLLDHIRKANVVAGESGGITQHIGAYHVESDQGDLTFLDTPGHEAFTAMRARGADVTDVVILVVAADDSIMPQTIEAISHAKNAGVPIVVAINKVDLPTGDPNRVRQELLQHGVTVEEFGGDVLSAEVSAKSGQGMDELLEKVLLQAELLDLKANAERSAQGTVIEAKKDVGKGPVVTVLVRKGTLRVGDDFVVGSHHGRVRALLDERGRSVKEAGPAVPVQLLGCPGVPEAGDTLTAMAAERAQQIAQTRQRLEREKELRIKERGIKLGDFSALISEGQTSRMPLIIKGDVQGSVQAVSDALQQLNTDEVGVDIIHHGVGAVNESDVLLAQTAGAVIVAFNVRPDTNARTLAEREGVDIQAFEVIYEAVDQVRSALEGMLAPEEKEEVLGTAEVRDTFKISRVGTVAGCYVTDGVIRRNGKVRLLRDGAVVYTGEIDSLKRFKDDVKEVREGFECGLGIKGFNDVKVGDVIECFTVEVVERTLAGAGSARGG